MLAPTLFNVARSYGYRIEEVRESPPAAFYCFYAFMLLLPIERRSAAWLTVWPRYMLAISSPEEAASLLIGQS
jgi:hypothetical protein